MIQRRVRYIVSLLVALQVLSHITHHTSHVTRHTSHITHHSSLITHHTSLITHHSSLITHHTSHITHHSSPITHHPSLITRHTSHATHPSLTWALHLTRPPSPSIITLAFTVSQARASAAAAVTVADVAPQASNPKGYMQGVQ